MSRYLFLIVQRSKLPAVYRISSRMGKQESIFLHQDEIHLYKHFGIQLDFIKIWYSKFASQANVNIFDSDIIDFVPSIPVVYFKEL